jgi:chromosome segregation ATPase
MSEEHKQSGAQTSGTPRWLGLAVMILTVVSLGSFGVGWNGAKRARSVEQALASQTQALKQNQGALAQRLTQAEQSDAQVRGGLDAVNNGLKLTRRELTYTRRTVEQIKEENAKLLESLRGELATKASSEDLNKLDGEVAGVKSNVEEVRQDLQAAQGAQGQLGALIAQNHEAIEQLRRAGERDYYEFTIDHKGARQKVGNLEVQLRGTNTKKNFFTVAIYAEDMRYEERNRSVNEPIYFYTRGSRTPVELVINEVAKNKIVGYLSVAKANALQQSTGN